jgi:predicted Zn-dependent peptidase
MKKLLLLLILGQQLMATTIHYIEIKDVKIPLIFEQTTTLPIASMQIVFKNSGAIKDGALPGLARISAKMMGEGTATRSSQEFADTLESQAISLSAHTGTETFVFEVGSLKEEFQTGISLLKEVLDAPNLSKKTLEKLQTNTIGALTRRETDYDYVAGNLLNEILYEGTPLQYNAMGDKKSVSKIKVDDIEAFLKENLILNNVIVILGGDISLENAKKYVKQALQDLEVGTTSKIENFSTSSKEVEKVLIKTTEQAYLYFGAPFNMDVSDSDYYKARVATFILGAGGFGSRMMEEIRVKRGLAYSAYARVGVSNSSSYFKGYLQTKNESLKEAKETVIEVIDTFVKGGVTADELEQAQKFLLGSEPLRVETLSQRLSRTFQEYYKGAEIGSSKNELLKIEALTLNELNTFIKKHSEIQKLSFAIVKEETK